ncbi:MAG: hypothetical protein V4683_07440 [Bacteroidota bacterium]
MGYNSSHLLEHAESPKRGRLGSGCQININGEYFVADFVVVPKVGNTLNFNDVKVLETKLSQGTSLTTNQDNALTKITTQPNSNFTIRSREKLSITSPTNSQIKLPGDIKITKMFKIHSDGNGDFIQNIFQL